VIDFRGCNSRGVSEIYRAFALLCAREEVRRALLKAGNEDPDAHFALRSAGRWLFGDAGAPAQAPRSAAAVT